MELLAEHSVISVQVLDEFTSVFRRKFGLSSSECREILGTVRAVCETQPLTVESHNLGIEISDRHGFCVYDSMIESERKTRKLIQQSPHSSARSPVFARTLACFLNRSSSASRNSAA